jgi:hypothetical protein
MPRYKPSLGDIEIQTPHRSFSIWFREELVNMQAWNPNVVFSTGNIFRFINEDKKELWRILVGQNSIRVKSQEPVVYLRHGLRIMMGSGRIELF